MKNLFLFHSGRVGSTFLASLLEQIPGVCWNSEIFSKNVFVYKGFERSGLAKKQGQGVFSLNEFIEYIKFAKKGRVQEPGVTCYGCEIKTYHFEYGLFKFSYEDCLEKLAAEFEDCQFGFLYRDNILRRLVSAQIAKKKNLYHLKKNNEVKLEKIYIDIENYHDFDLNSCGNLSNVIFESKLKETRYINATKINSGLILEYESDLNSNYLNAIDKIESAWKGLVRPQTFEISLKRTNPFDLIDIIENYGEVMLSLGSAQRKLFF